MEKKYENIIEQLQLGLDEDLCDECIVNNRAEIISAIKTIQIILYPNYYHYKGLTRETAFVYLEKILGQEIRVALKQDRRNPEDTEALMAKFVDKIPGILHILNTDLQAIYDGDPAAKTKAEILLCYPGFYGILIYRIAHALRELDIPYIPRIMTEYAHEKTGIDINPGAIIGEYFCIDHGTGVVIGETTVIGNHVKLYQGVTLGALSFAKDENGNPVKSGKRHPNIGNNVVIYANATVLGGGTTIGDNCVIGGNAWITSSIESGKTVYNAE